MNAPLTVEQLLPQLDPQLELELPLQLESPSPPDL